MDIDSVETTQCTNCKHDILSSNFVIHTIHCQRNIYLCSKCNEPVNHSQKEEHDEAYHKQIFCTSCHLPVEKYLLNQHILNHCPKRKVKCQICDIDVGAEDINDHENYCGARTEKCSECGEFVMLKYKQLHLDSNHTFIKLSDEPGPSPSWLNTRTTFGSYLNDINSGSTKFQRTQKKKTSQSRKQNEFDSENIDGKNLKESYKKWTTQSLHVMDFDKRKSPTTSSSQLAAATKSKPLGQAPGVFEETADRNFSTPDKKVATKVMKEPMNQGNDDLFEIDRLLALQISEDINGLNEPIKPNNKALANEEDSDLMMAFQMAAELNQEEDENWDNYNSSATINKYLKSTHAFADVIDKSRQEVEDAKKNLNLHKNKSKTTVKPKVTSYLDDLEDEFLVYSKEQNVSLPCEFCGTLIPSKNLALHETGCSMNLKINHFKEPVSQRKFIPRNEEHVEIPCEFCDHLFPISDLESHQTSCDKRSSYNKEKGKQYLEKTPNRPSNKSTKHQAGLQNGIDNSSGFGTRQEFLGDRSRVNGDRQKNHNNPPEAGRGTGAVPRTQQARNLTPRSTNSFTNTKKK